MTTQPTPQEAVGGSNEAIVSHVMKYNSRLLTKEQSATMLGDIRVAVLSAQPTSEAIAGNWLSVVSRFVVDVALPSGGSFAETLTPAKIATWLAAQERAGVPRHTLRTRKGILDQVLRVMNGLEPKAAKTKPHLVGAAPMPLELVQAVRDACTEASMHALRGFVSVVGTGKSAASLVGGTFRTEPSGLSLVYPNGERIPVAGQVLSNSADQLPIGQVVMDGDWAEALFVASGLGLHLDSKLVSQTFRQLALAEPLSLVELVTRFSLSYEALRDAITYLPAVDVTEVAIMNLLRG